jgi:hypothetical protein
VRQSLTLVLGMTLGCAAAAQDRADLERATIVGNRELPKVTTIVPWKKPLPGELAGRPVRSVLDEALEPVDRDVFRRQIAFDAQWRERATAAPAIPTAPTPSPEKRP